MKIRSTSRKKRRKDAAVLQKASLPSHVIIWMGISPDGLSKPFFVEPKSKINAKYYDNKVLKHSIRQGLKYVVVKAPKGEGVVDPKSGECRLVSLLLSGSRGRKSAPKGDSSRCVWRKQTAMSVRDNI
ncbi:hypothetical protein TNCV_512261 [Trichonephila clavipes]|nr:hypothetical protein TNCV_512261 [Trichonephila clavipes]